MTWHTKHVRILWDTFYSFGSRNYAIWLNNIVSSRRAASGTFRVEFFLRPFLPRPSLYQTTAVTVKNCWLIKKKYRTMRKPSLAKKCVYLEKKKRTWAALHAGQLQNRNERVIHQVHRRLFNNLPTRVNTLFCVTRISWKYKNESRMAGWTFLVSGGWIVCVVPGNVGSLRGK